MQSSAFGSRKRLEAHRRRELNLCHRCHEFPEKSSKIVPLGAPSLISRSRGYRVEGLSANRGGDAVSFAICAITLLSRKP
jgi:cytochrome c553